MFIRPVDLVHIEVTWPACTALCDALVEPVRSVVFMPVVHDG